jgi:methylated-DNA-[protein]-cysteine S-methyltransferase
MATVIQWEEKVCGPIEIIKLITPAGFLALSSQQGVISKALWQSDNSTYLQELKIQQHFMLIWLNTDQEITIRLLKQGSPYRHRVWAEIARIPYGETITYSEIARKINSSPRAVGNACRDNPYPLVIPCHRVVAVSGLGGYYGQIQGEVMDIKSKLLNFEAAHKK